jgi:signal transduction histidine kinase
VSDHAAVTSREWALFGLRWLYPLAFIAVTILSPEGGGLPAPSPVVLASIGSLLANLVLLLFLVMGVWNRPLTVVMLAIDAAVICAAVYFIDARLAWLGIVPAAVAGIYFGWLASLWAGIALAALLAALQVSTLAPPSLGPAYVAMLAVTIPAAGPAAYMLAASRSREDELSQRRQRRREEEAVAATRRAIQTMRVVYDMTEVLSASKLDPNRVLDSAVTFGLEGLERVGVEPPLFGAILLFANDEDGVATMLRIAWASPSVEPIDYEIAIPGIGGAINKALTNAQPAIAGNPGTDAELREFETFRVCGTALVLPLNAGQDSYGVMLVGSRQEDAFRDIHVELMRAVANQAAASLNNAKLYVALREQRDRLVEVDKYARAQLAAELHDGPTQSMSAITMRLNYIRRLLEREPHKAPDELYKVEDLARRTTREVRMMLFELRPKSLDHGLEPGLRALADKMNETYGQNVEVYVERDIDRLLDSHATVSLFSIVTETLHNARKHARADLITVSVRVQGGALVLAVEDNGRGFDVEQALAEAHNREGHLGLLNLKDRAALVEGALDIDSTPGEGTRISVVIPLDVLEARRAEESRQQMAEGPAPFVASPPPQFY